MMVKMISFLAIMIVVDAEGQNLPSTCFEKYVCLIDDEAK